MLCIYSHHISTLCRISRWTQQPNAAPFIYVRSASVRDYIVLIIMNELGDLFTRPEEIICSVCGIPVSIRYLRSGLSGHMLNVHQLDENNKPVVKKKSTRRRIVNNNTIRAPTTYTINSTNSANISTTTSSISVTQGDPTVTATSTASLADAEINENENAEINESEDAEINEREDPEINESEDTNDSLGREQIVGNKDLDDGLVFADEDIWGNPIFTGRSDTST